MILSDHQPKIDCCIQRILYMNLMVTTNQIPIKGTQNIDRKSNITLSQVTKSQRKEQEKKGAENYQNNWKQLTKWQ